VLSDDIDLQPIAEQIANQSVSESDGLLVLVIAKRIAYVMRGKVHASIDYGLEASLQEAFCATGKGGKRDPHCSPKNKGTGKAKPASGPRRKKQEPVRVQSEKAPEKIDASKWEDESKSVVMRMSALGQAGHKLTSEQHAESYWKLHKAYYSDANREDAIGLADQMLKDAKAGKIDEEYLALGKQMAQQEMRDEYYKTTQSKERRKASEFEPTEEAIKAKAAPLQAAAAKEDIDLWESQAAYLKKMQKENVPDAEGIKTVANRSRAEHVRSVADALKRGQDVPADNVIRYLGSSTLPPEETKRFMTAHSSMEANRELQAFSKVAESHAPAIEKALQYGASVREGFVTKAKQYLSDVESASKQSMVADAKLAQATSQLGKIKELAASQGITDLKSLPENHPVAKQYNDQINSIKQLSIASQDASQAKKDSNEVFHELLSHSDTQKPAIYALGVGYQELPKEVQAKADKAAKFFEKVLHPSVIGGSSEAVEVDLGSSGDRAHAKVEKKIIAMDPSDAAETFVHEMAHVFESNSKQSDYAAMSSAFLFNRAKETQGSDMPKASHMGGVYRSNEQRVEDKLSGAYAEKWYGGRYASEVISMGAQQLFSDPLRFAEEHPEHFDFTVAYLHGKVQNQVVSGDVAER